MFVQRQAPFHAHGQNSATILYPIFAALKGTGRRNPSGSKAVAALHNAPEAGTVRSRYRNLHNRLEDAQEGREYT
jgi:hypothetical protein